MNKRKVLSILLLALITVTLAVSCSSNIDTPAANTEELAYVTFGNGHSRELGTSYQTEPYNLLYWFYTAQKTDSYGTTGQVGLDPDGKPTEAVSKNGEDPAQGLSGRVGPFSQGAWKFKLYAYGYTKTGEGTTAIYTIDRNKLVYESDEVSVTLKGGDVKNVPVSVSTRGETGYVRLNNVTFNWKNGGGTAAPTGKLVFKGTNHDHDFEIFSAFSEGSTSAFVLDGPITYKDNTYNIPADFYTVTATAYLKQDADPTNNQVAIDNEGTPLFSQTFGLRVYGNATTVISGDIIEGVNSKVTFDVADQTMRVFSVVSNNTTPVKVAITAQNGNKESAETKQDNEWTTVSFPAGTLDSSSVHQLDVKVTPLASAEQKFQVSDTTQTDGVTRTAVAGIDLKMVKVQKNADGSTQEVNVTSFGKDSANKDRKVTITTYIATGLSDVEVKYLNSNNNLEHIAGPIENKTGTPSYDPATGKLVFETTHFSQYVVVSPVEAINVSTGVPYTSLAKAIAAAGDGQEIQLKKNVNVESAISINKNLTIDLNNRTFATNSKIILNTSSKGCYVTFKNGTVTRTNSDSHVFVLTNDTSLILDNVKVNGGWCGIMLTETNKNMTVKVLNHSEIHANVFGISTNATEVASSGVHIEVKDSLIETTSEDQDNTGILFNVRGSVYIENSTIKGNRQAIILRGGTDSVIKNSIIEATGEKTTYNDWTDGGNSIWGTGNMVPLASLVVGNHSNLGSMGYAYPVSVTLDNATINYSGTRKGIYVYKTDNTVNIDGTIASATSINSDMNGAVFNVSGVIIEGIAGFENKFFSSANEAYSSIRSFLSEKCGLGEEVLEEEKFNSLFVNNGAIVWNIYGQQEMVETDDMKNYLLFGRSSMHFGNQKHVDNITVKGRTKDAKIVCGNKLTIPYEWWGEKKAFNITFTDIEIEGNENQIFLTQSFIENVNIVYQNCTLKSKIYCYFNTKYSLKIDNCIIEPKDSNSYAIHAQGNATSPASVTIKKSTIRNSRGINLDQATCTATIDNNVIEYCGNMSNDKTNNYYGVIQITKGNSITISSNKISNCGGNVFWIWSNESGTIFDGSLSIKNNTIKDCLYLFCEANKKTSYTLESENNTITKTITDKSYARLYDENNKKYFSIIDCDVVLK